MRILLHAVTVFLCSLTPALTAQTVYAEKDLWQTRLVFANDNETEIPLKTRFNVDFDEKNLYVTVVCTDPKASELQKISSGKKGEWPLCDSVEIFLDPGRTCGKYFQIATGVNGTMYDSRCKKEWITEWSAGMTFSKDAWQVRFTLPFSDPGMVHPKIGDIWGFNLCRNVKLSGRYFSTWAQVGSVFNRPALFGKLIFGSPEAAEKAMNAKVSLELDQLEKELRTKGGYEFFAPKIQALHRKCSELDIRDIRDEWIVIEAINHSKIGRN